MKRDIYLLLANQLTDIHHRLSSKILENKQYKPSWKVTEIPAKAGIVPRMLIVDDLAEIKSLILTLDRLAGPEPYNPEMTMPNFGDLSEKTQ